VTRRPPTLTEIKALSAMQVHVRRGRAEQAVTAFLNFAFTDRLGHNSWASFPEEWRAIARAHAQPALTDFRIAVGAYPTKRQLAAIQAPVLCTYGERSSLKMIRLTRGLSHLIPTATLAEIPGAAHAAAFDAPDEFARVVLTAASAATSTANEPGGTRSCPEQTSNPRQSSLTPRSTRSEPWNGAASP
jgi:pimeloyl-ACP methyl ester carboxylesterase